MQGANTACQSCDAPNRYRVIRIRVFVALCLVYQPICNTLVNRQAANNRYLHTYRGIAYEKQEQACQSNFVSPVLCVGYIYIFSCCNEKSTGLSLLSL